MDVHRREGPGSDKVATIYGAPEACGAAAIRILEIVRKEDKDNDLPLRVLAHNALIGRLIGRDGRNLKLIQVNKLMTPFFRSSGLLHKIRGPKLFFKRRASYHFKS